MYFFSCKFIFLLVSRLKKAWNCFKKRPIHLSHFEKFLPTRLLRPTRLLNFKISSHLHCYSDSTLIQHLKVCKLYYLNSIIIWHIGWVWFLKLRLHYSSLPTLVNRTKVLKMLIFSQPPHDEPLLPRKYI